MLSALFASIMDIFLAADNVTLPQSVVNPYFCTKASGKFVMGFMRKKIMLLVLGLITSFAVFAQEEPIDENAPEPMPEAPTRNFRIGVRTGGALSTVGQGNFINPSLLFGLTGGINARYKFGKIHDDRPEAYRFGYEAQLNFVYKGSNFKNQNTEYNKVSFFYGDLSMYGILKIDKQGYVKLLAGPYAGYLINSSVYIKPQVTQDTTVLKLKDMDYGYGIGLEFKTRPIGFQVIVKQGLRNLNDGMNALNYPQIMPAFTGGRVRNFSVEIVLSF